MARFWILDTKETHGNECWGVIIKAAIARRMGITHARVT